MKKSLLSRVEALPIMMVYVIILIAFMFTAPETFLGFRIYQSFMSTVPPPMLLALGFTLIVATGEIDLSFPAVIAFSGFVFAALFKITGQTLMPLIAALAAGALIGFVNGVLIAVIGIPSIIATLGAQFLWHGLTVILSGGLAWNIRDIREEVIHQLFTGRIGGYVPAQMLWVLGIAVILWFILNRHKFGEHVLFIGDNAHVAQVMGVNVRRTKIALFTLMGFLGAIAAVLLTLEMSTFWTTQGQGFLLISIAAVFIGGTSIFGGEATIVGTVFGALIVGSIEAGVVASGLGGFWTRFIVGLVLIVTVTLHIVIGKGKGLSPSKAKRARMEEADAAARPPQQGSGGPS
jgi:simple sugar transport system permease protein